MKKPLALVQALGSVDRTLVNHGLNGRAKAGLVAAALSVRDSLAVGVDVAAGMGDLSIPRDESHRFLEWQPKLEDCDGWVDWFASRGAPYRLVYRAGVGWTIYKHFFKQRNSRDPAKFCCGSSA